MFEAAFSALGSIFQPGVVVLLVAGMLCGLVIGLLPGLGGTAAVAILLPFAVNLDPQHSLALIIGAVAVVHTSDTISAVLLGVPGSASATVTMMDGHAMARQGQAARALGLAFASSMAGGLLGAVGLTFSIPIARPLVLSFGSPELFMLTVLGISLAALLSRGNMLRGLVAGVLGVLIGQIGAAPTAAVYRFTFGSLFLYDGLDLIAVALGVFGLAEIAHLLAKRSAVAERIDIAGGWLDGLKDFLVHWKLVLRGALVGIWAGVLPGIGATAGTFMAYGQTVATAKDRSRFGKGDPRGIVAPESANNSVEAGDLIPTLLFGIPGGAPAALLLGALLVYGIQPGPRLVTDHLDIVYTIIWAFALASVIGSFLCFLMSKPLARLSYLPFTVLAPALVVVMLMSSYQSSDEFGDLVVMLLLGVIGYVMKLAGFPRAPFLIGFVLSVPLERYYFLTANLYTTGQWVSRPLVIAMFVILAAPLALAAVRRVRAWRAAASAPGGARGGGRVASGGPVARAGSTGPGGSAEDGSPAGAAGERAADGPGDDDSEAMGASLWPLAFGSVALVAFVVALVTAQGYPERARLVPNLVCVIGAVLTAVLVAREVLAVRRRRRGGPNWSPDVTQTAVAFGWIVLFLILASLLGFVVAAAVFTPLFLWRVAGMRPLPLVLYTCGMVAALIVAVTLADLDLPNGILLPALPFVIT